MRTGRTRAKTAILADFGGSMRGFQPSWLGPWRSRRRANALAMACLGVHFAITSDQAKRLIDAEGDDETLVDIVKEEIEQEWAFAIETHKAWDALHRCLSNGTLDCDAGEPPLNRVFFGGRVLNSTPDYFVVLNAPNEVKEIAAALATVTEEWLKNRYSELPFVDYQDEKSDEDWDHTFGNFEGLPDFFASAANRELYVIFTVDQ